MARKPKKGAVKTVNPEDIAAALAKAVYAGDIVNFRLLFMSFSPARVETSEAFGTEKYTYLLPDAAMVAQSGYQQALECVRQDAVWAHVLRELAAKRPPQLPAEPLILLADNAVREGKYTVAGQAYELLRIRRRMQEEFLEQAGTALEEGNIPRAVRGYRIATGLDYDYAAFPEPLPKVPNYQTQALALHGKYPVNPEDCISLRLEEAHVNALLEFLLNDVEITARLRDQSLETRKAFAVELVHLVDPAWEEFSARYRESCAMALALNDHLRHRSDEALDAAGSLEEEIAEQSTSDPAAIMTHLLGRELDGGEWWQYLKEIAYKHPAGVLFVTRQFVGDREVLLPRFRADSSLVGILGLEPKMTTENAPA